MNERMNTVSQPLILKFKSYTIKPILSPCGRSHFQDRAFSRYSLRGYLSDSNCWYQIPYWRSFLFWGLYAVCSLLYLLMIITSVVMW